MCLYALRLEASLCEITIQHSLRDSKTRIPPVKGYEQYQAVFRVLHLNKRKRERNDGLCQLIVFTFVNLT